MNRFRGDASLLEPAHRYVLDYTGRPVLGVVPYLANLGLPEEDSVEFKSGALDQPAGDGDRVDVAVVDLPHISNFTDFDAFRAEEDVHLRIVRSANELNTPDAVILPGSKNVPGDLRYLRESGIGERIEALAARSHTEVVGICAGYQMLGRTVRDPHGLESSSGETKGLALPEIETTLAEDKTLVRSVATHGPSGEDVYGYEIHHGVPRTDGHDAVFRREDGACAGVARDDGRVWGTYLHGVFDADGFRRWFVNRLRARRGWAPRGSGAEYDIEPALDRLADAVRAGLDMDRIRKLMGL